MTLSSAFLGSCFPMCKNKFDHPFKNNFALKQKKTLRDSDKWRDRLTDRWTVIWTDDRCTKNGQKSIFIIYYIFASINGGEVIKNTNKDDN